MFAGIDTSAYTTSVALVSESEQLIEEARVPIEVSKGQQRLR